MRELHLFAGAGGGILGGMLLGHTCVCAVEIEPYCRKVLFQRQRDGILPKFPIWDDVKTFDGRDWRGRVDVVCGGFPCQDISAAGKGAGINGERSGLWSEMARVVREVGPKYVLVENSPMLVIRGLDRVLADLSEMGFDAKWGVFSGFDTDGVLQRERIFMVAHRVSDRILCDSIPVYSRTSHGVNFWKLYLKAKLQDTLRNWEMAHGELCGVDDGMAISVDRLKSIGNGQIPAVVRLAWRILSQ